MTCSIMLFDKKSNTLTLGTDSATTAGYEKMPTKKIKSGYIGIWPIVYAGDCSVSQSLKLFHPPEISRSDDSFSYVYRKLVPALRQFFIDSYLWSSDKSSTIRPFEIIICIDGILYNIDSYLSALEIGTFYAIGSGAITAMAVIDVMLDSGMENQEIVKLALETASKYNIGVESPFSIVTIDYSEKKAKKKK